MDWTIEFDKAIEQYSAGSGSAPRRAYEPAHHLPHRRSGKADGISFQPGAAGAADELCKGLRRKLLVVATAPTFWSRMRD